MKDRRGCRRDQRHAGCRFNLGVDDSYRQIGVVASGLSVVVIFFCIAMVAVFMDDMLYGIRGVRIVVLQRGGDSNVGT